MQPCANAADIPLSFFSFPSCARDANNSHTRTFFTPYDSGTAVYLEL